MRGSSHELTSLETWGSTFHNLTNSVLILIPRKLCVFPVYIFAQQSSNTKPSLPGIKMC